MSNLIQINDKYAIGSDVNQWMIMKPVTVKDKDTGKKETKWQSFKYFTDIEAAVRELWHLLLRQGECTGMADLVALSREISQLLSEKFTSEIKLQIRE